MTITSPSRSAKRNSHRIPRQALTVVDTGATVRGRAPACGQRPGRSNLPQPTKGPWKLKSSGFTSTCVAPGFSRVPSGEISATFGCEYARLPNVVPLGVCSACPHHEKRRRQVLLVQRRPIQDCCGGSMVGFMPECRRRMPARKLDAALA